MSHTVSPVTQLAEVAVNRQSKSGVNVRAFDAIGRHSNSEPVTIIIRKPITSVLAGLKRFDAFLKIGIILTSLVYL